MTEPPSDKPPRRPRYRGTHPRAFHEKYKEQQPDRYADDVAHVLASGKTPAGSHRPIMVSEILAVLKPEPGDGIVDCTLGYGGHATQLLQAVQPGGRLLGLDVDPIELPKTEARLKHLGYPTDSITVRRSNFAGLSAAVATVFPNGADLILADLGVSSMQLDDPTRGFTFKADALLDMRMNPYHGQSAAQLLSKLDEARLAKLLVDNADEPRAVQLARTILQAQADHPIETTQSLAEVIRRSLSQIRNLSPDETQATIRRVFQALRIDVNDEYGALDALLRQIPASLKAGGRVAILTFHSGEDRRVKRAFKSGMEDGTYEAVTDFLMRPTPDEQRANPRSGSAKLRFARRL
jgi:16S rRNA (cytosine1402-N4)-methyltransferase